MDYHKFIAYKKRQVNEKTRKDCLNWATVILDKYSHLEDWHKMYFSDKIHFVYENKDKLRIIWKAGMRYCQICIKEMQEPTKKDKALSLLDSCWA